MDCRAILRVDIRFYIGFFFKSLLNSLYVGSMALWPASTIDRSSYEADARKVERLNREVRAMAIPGGPWQRKGSTGGCRSFEKPWESMSPLSKGLVKGDILLSYMHIYIYIHIGIYCTVYIYICRHTIHAAYLVSLLVCTYMCICVYVYMYICI